MPSGWALTCGTRLEGCQRRNAVRSPRCAQVGLMIGIDLSQDMAKDVVLRALDKGLILNATGPHTLRMVPPLILTEQEADKAVDTLASLI